MTVWGIETKIFGSEGVEVQFVGDIISAEIELLEAGEE